MLRLPDTDDPQGSWGTRTRYYRESLALFGRNASWGVGTGDWGPEMGLGLGRNYPHNIVLELACEQGVPGLAIAFAIALWTVSLLRRAARAEGDRALLSTLAALAVFWIANAQLSGDLIDNRSIWWPLLALEIVLAMRRLPDAVPVALVAEEKTEVPTNSPLVPEPAAARHGDPVATPTRWS
jgi:O-antigen ligase